MKAFIFLFAAIAVALTSTAQQNALDNTFGNNGKLIHHINLADGVIYSAAQQSDGKIVVAGSAFQAPYSQFILMRYHTDGSIDSSFGTNGMVMHKVNGYYERAHSVLILPDGKILAGGVSDEQFALVRYLSDGSIDQAFGAAGRVVTSLSVSNKINSLLLQPDGKIVAAGGAGTFSNINFAIARFLPNGSLDYTFGNEGKTVTDFKNGYDFINEIALQPDGKIVAAGLAEDGVYSFALARYLSDGNPDSSFGTGGKVVTPVGELSYASAVAIQPDGKIIAGGASGKPGDTDFTMIRYNADGMPDPDFGTGGTVVTDMSIYDDEPRAILLQPDGRIILAGSTKRITGVADFTLFRYNADGFPDITYGGGGKVVTDFSINSFINSSFFQPDGKIVAAGFTERAEKYDFAIARYLSVLDVGILDFSLQTTAYIYPNPLHGSAILEYTLAEEEEVSVQLLDLQGQVISIFAENRRQKPGDHKELLVMPADLAAGNYLLVIASPKGRVNVQVTKQE